MSETRKSEKKKEDVSQTPSLPLSARALLSRQLGSRSASGRLPSLRPARDLSLGATPKLTFGGKAKRTFTPTIPTRRIKEEPKKESSRNQSPSFRDRRDHHHGEGRGRGRGKRGRGRGEIVASQSVFSMGPAEKLKSGQTITTSSFIGGERRNDKTSQVSVKKERYECNDEESKRILKMLQLEDDNVDDECTEYGMAPVSIPLSNYLQKVKEVEDKKDITIKEEPMEVDLDDTNEKIPKPRPIIKSIPTKTEHKEPTCSSLFSTEPDEEKFLFIQLPDKLPIKLEPKEPKEPKDPPASNQPANDNEQPKDKKEKPSNPNVSLKDVSEGYIGKLQVLKSGKTRLVLGDVSLDVAMGTSCSFLQELVAVHTDENRSDMTVLGQVKHRVICTPDFEKLLIASRYG